jgi:hypothetical protein
MDQFQPIADPFALMMNPEAVFQAMERSDRLSRLKRRVCRPLDRPLIPVADDDLSEFDRDIEASADEVVELLGIEEASDDQF